VVQELLASCGPASWLAGPFLIAIFVIVAWIATGPVFGFSDTWQLVINTGTTIITFLMVFLIQNTQNRDAQAIHLKLDELLRAVQAARTELVDVEDTSEEEMDELQAEFRRLHDRVATKRKLKTGDAETESDQGDAAG
jgi:low affinity Fe/Cu permease